MPPLVRFLLIHAALGFAIAFVFVGLLLAFDFDGLRTLMLGSEIGYLALFMFTLFTGFTTASIQIGVAVMLLGEDKSDDSFKSHPLLVRIWTFIKSKLMYPPKRTITNV